MSEFVLMRIEICGGIATGKTTLCHVLSSQGFSSYCEQFQENPFWRDFYDDPVKFAFETELTFLLQHYNDIKKNLFISKAVFDFSLVQDLAYADVNLRGRRKSIFMTLADELLEEIGLSNLLIYITCPPHIALQRIHKRKRDVESSITIDYLEALNLALEQRIVSVPNAVTVLRINSSDIDFRADLPQILKNLI